MEDMRTILYVFRDKLEVETCDRWKTLDRMKQLRSCTLTQIYMQERNGQLYYLSDMGFRVFADPATTPDVIKLAAMLTN